MASQYSFLVSYHMIEIQEIGLSMELQRVVGLHQILAGNVTHNYYMLGTTTKLSMLFYIRKSWGCGYT